VILLDYQCRDGRRRAGAEDPGYARFARAIMILLSSVGSGRRTRIIQGIAAILWKPLTLQPGTGSSRRSFPPRRRRKQATGTRAIRRAAERPPILLAEDNRSTASSPSGSSSARLRPTRSLAQVERRRRPGVVLMDVRCRLDGLGANRRSAPGGRRRSPISWR
jgi:hypothetical protein